MSIEKWLIESVNTETGETSSLEYNSRTEAQDAFNSIEEQKNVLVTLRKSTKKLLTEA